MFVQIFVIWGLDSVRFILLNINAIMVKRLFIGVPIESETVKLAVKSWMSDPLFSHRLLNWVNPENWHITLVFLGNQPMSSIALLQQIIEESFCSVHAFNTRIIGAGVFPNQHNPKVLWLSINNLQLLLPAYSQMVELLQQNRFSFSNKLLKPHLTVARIKRLEHSASFESFLTQNQQFSFGSVAINRVVLYESISTINGPVYKPLFVKELEFVQEQTI